jgi:hypothetical protein
VFVPDEQVFVAAAKINAIFSIANTITELPLFGRREAAWLTFLIRLARQASCGSGGREATGTEQESRTAGE